MPPAFALIRAIGEVLGKRDRSWLALLVLMMIVAAGFEVLGIGMIVPLIAAVSTEQSSAHEWLQRLYVAGNFSDWPTFVLAIAASVFLAFLAKNAYLALFAYVQARFIFGRYATLSERLLAGYLTAPHLTHLQRNSADLIRNLTHEVTAFVTGVLLPGLTIVAEVLVLLAMVALLLAVNPKIAAATFLFFGGTALLVQWLLKPLFRRAGHDRVEQSSTAIRWIQQTLGAAKEIKLAAREAYFLDAFRGAIGRYARASRVFATVNAAPRLFVEMLGIAVVMLMLALVRDRSDLLPLLVLYGLAAMRLMPSFTRIFSAVNTVRFYQASVGILARDLAGTDVPRPAKLSSAEAVEVIRSAPSIEVRELSFYYPGSAHPAVDRISFRIPAGSIVGIEGPSGAGKSTLVDLLLGLMKPTSGQILMDGGALDELAPGWQQRAGYVPQVPFLMDDSVRRNVAFGVIDETIDDTRVLWALEAAQLAPRIAELEGRLDGMVGERGLTLSVGERQRLGIARALYKDARLLFLDEPTSALDANTERELAAIIRGLRGDRTIIVISHRSALLEICDMRIALLDGTLERAAALQT